MQFIHAFIKSLNASNIDASMILMKERFDEFVNYCEDSSVLMPERLTQANTMLNNLKTLRDDMISKFGSEIHEHIASLNYISECIGTSSTLINIIQKG